MKREKKIIRVTLEYALLISAIVIHVVFFMVNKLEQYPLALNVARYTSSYNEFCQLLEYTGRCELAFIYTWLFSKIPPQLIVSIQVIALLAIYRVNRKVFGTGVIGALAALAYAITPSALLLYTLEQSGLLLLSSLITISTLLVIDGSLIGSKKASLLVGLAVYVFMVLHPAGALPLLAFLIMLLLDYVERPLDTWKVKVFIIMASAMLVALVFAKPTNYDVYTIPLLAMAISFLIATYTTSKMAQPSYRVIVLIAVTLLGVITGVLIYAIGAYKGTIYITALSPIEIYGLPGLLAIPGFLLTVKTTAERAEKYAVAIALIIGLLVTISPLVAPTALALLTLVGSVFLSRTFRALTESVALAGNVDKLLIALGVTAFIVIPVFGSYAASLKLTRTNVLFEEIAELSRERNLGAKISDLRDLDEDIVRAVKSTARGEKILLITRWDYSYWVQSALVSRDVKVMTLSHLYGSPQSKSLLSRIMVSEWGVSREILKNISRDIGVADVYVLTTITYSVGYTNYSYIGVPYAMYTATSQYPILMFEAYGDIANIPLYLKLANKSEGDYLFLATGMSEKLRSLLWTTRGKEMFLAQLSVLAINKIGYSAVYNYLIEANPLNATMTGLDLVYFKEIPVGKISIAYYGEYDIYYTIALFRLGECCITE